MVQNPYFDSETRSAPAHNTAVKFCVIGVIVANWHLKSRENLLANESDLFLLVFITKKCLSVNETLL